MENRNENEQNFGQNTNQEFLTNKQAFPFHITPPNSEETNQQPEQPSAKNNLLKKIGVIVGITLAVSSIAWLSYRWYQRSSDEKILATAAKNLLETKDLHSKATFGIMGLSLRTDIYIDKDQDAKITLDTSYGKGEGIYLPKDDKAYAGTSSSLMAGGSSDKTRYIELTNIKKTLDKYEQELSLTDIFNPKKNFFTGENIKYIKKVGVDTIDGKKLYKFSFTPTDSFVQEKLNKATKGKDLPFALKKSDISINFWIKNDDLRISKLEGVIKVTTESSPSEKKKQEKAKEDCLNRYKNDDYYSSNDSKTMCDYYGKDYYKQELKLDWSQSFSYGFKDNIVAPNKNDVTSSIDIFKQLDQNYQNDKRKVSDLKEIQDALQDYKKDKGYYPRNLDQLKNENKSSSYEDSSLYLYSMPESPDDNKYEYKTSGNTVKSYTLSVKLVAPEYYKNSEHIKDGLLILTEKNSSFKLEEK